MTLQVIWFILVFVLLAGYIVLDGFDLGVGVLHLLAQNEYECRININAIGPVWDGNEVWLLTAGGALFAAFPPVYAAAFSGFYIALMLVLAMLMFRAVSLEFRGKVDSEEWRAIWDYGFGISSTLLAILFGVAIGNVLLGVPLAPDGTYTGTFLELLNPYAILIGVLALVTFIMHGAIFMAGKTEGPMQARMIMYARRAWLGFAVLFFAITVYTRWAAPSLFSHFSTNYIALAFLLLIVAGSIGLAITLRVSQLKIAMLASCAIVGSLMGLAAAGLFPRLLPSRTDPAASLTIYNSSSTPRTLGVMLVIALIGMPLVIGYTAVIYHIFCGKVVLHEDSY